MPVSKQLVPATISRGRRSSAANWAGLYGRYGYLSTAQQRRLGNWGVPGAAKSSLIHMAVNHPWQIVNPDGKPDDSTRYYTDLLRQANGGLGGAKKFLSAWADDLVCAREGGLFEIVREDLEGIPTDLFNIDAATITFNTDPDRPSYTQRVNGGPEVAYFDTSEMCHSLWHPMTEIEVPMANRTPIQLAYLAVTMLANGDDWNIKILTEAIPQGLLNLGPGFDEDKALAWKAQWDAATLGGRLDDIGLLWGTDKVDFHAFNIPPVDMGFENSNIWNAGIVAACFDMAVSDINIAGKAGTRGGAAEAGTKTRRGGLRHLMGIMAEGMEHYLLPPDYKMRWDDLDPRDEKAEAEVKRTNGQTLLSLIQALGIEVGVTEAVAQGLIEADRIKDIPNVVPLLAAYAQLQNPTASGGVSTGKPSKGGAKRQDTTPQVGNNPGTTGDEKQGTAVAAAR